MNDDPTSSRSDHITQSPAMEQPSQGDPDAPLAVVPADPIETEKRHTAPITPFVHGVQVGGVFGVLTAVSVISSGGLAFRNVLAAIGVIIVVVIAVAVVAYLQWQRLVYWFDADGDLRVSSGLLQRRERRLHLSRLQSVEVVQPLLARIFGMAQVRIEVAGAGDSRVTLAYLTLKDAQDLRSETLARAAGVRPDAGEAPETVLVQVPSGTLLWSNLLSTEVIVWVVITVIAVVVLGVMSGPWSLLGLFAVVGVPLLSAFSNFTSYFNFTVADSPDGLRTRCGLLSVQAHTVPPGRVASIEFVEPLLWRKFGWVSVRLNVAGVQADSEGGTGAANTLLPVATWDVAREVTHRLFPGLDVPNFPFQSVPEQVKWRSPLQRRRLGLGADQVMMGTRRGWLTLRTTFTPHARVQSVRVEQGPWQRKLGLASVHADVVPGPVRAVGKHQGVELARDFVYAEVERVRTATLADTSLRWAALRGADGATADPPQAPDSLPVDEANPLPADEPGR